MTHLVDELGCHYFSFYFSQLTVVNLRKKNERAANLFTLMLQSQFYLQEKKGKKPLA